jgi:endonuclease/exonuclease/phosphatase family metal-dependent hydrolase
MMMKNILLFCCFAVILFSCEDQNRQIIVPGGNPQDTTKQPVDPKTKAKPSACLFVGTDSTLDIMTWNIEQFPKHSETIDRVATLISNMNLDIIAFQEINNRTSFETLRGKLNGWASEIDSKNSVGYFYKTAEVERLEFFELFRGDTYSFPRPAPAMSIKHKSGLEITLINLHLKCCGQTEDIARRTAASQRLKSYVESTLSKQNVVILGDWNDVIAGNLTGAFDNFLNDKTKYLFADLEIAQNFSLGWSYPSFPSHIDHILINAPLFEAFVEVMTVSPDKCEPVYFSTISDHRPVAIRLKKTSK